MPYRQIIHNYFIYGEIIFFTEHHEKVVNGVVEPETAESMVRGILDDMVDKIVISHRNGGRKGIPVFFLFSKRKKIQPNGRTCSQNQTHHKTHRQVPMFHDSIS